MEIKLISLQLSRDKYSLPLIFLVSLLGFLAVFSFDYSPTHHAYVRIIEQNILDCSTWACFKETAFVHTFKGGLYIQFLAQKFLRIFGFSNGIHTNFFTGALFNSFFIFSIAFVLRKQIKDWRLSFRYGLAILISSPLLIRQMFLTEDNIYYYGLVLIYLYFQFNDYFKDWRDSFLGGLALGLSIWLHTSPLIFLFAVVLTPFNKKFGFVTLWAFGTYYIFHLFTHFNDFWLGSFWLATKQIPLHSYIIDAITLKSGAKSSDLSFLSALRIGFEDINHYYKTPDVLRYLGYFSWASLLCFLGINFKNLKIDWKVLFLLGISLGPVLIYEPQFGERWDFFLIILIFIFIQFVFTKKDLKFPHLLIGFLFLQSVNTGALAVSGSPYRNQQTKMTLDIKKKLPSLHKKDFFVFHSQYLRIEPFIISHLKGKEGQIYFSDGKKFYQTYFSLMAKETLRIDQLWGYNHFQAWMSNDAMGEPIGVQEVRDGCESLKQKNGYISETLIESLKQTCL